MSIPTYAPRQMTGQPLWTIGDTRLKPTFICANTGHAPDGTLLEAALGVAARVLPDAIAEEGGAHDLGFAVLHRGQDHIWLLLHWWAHGDICCQRLFRTDIGDLAFEPMAGRPLMACVWEMRVIEHESKSWIRTMMTGSPAPEAYLADRLPDGMH